MNGLKPGFLIMEFLVYFFLFSFLSYGVVHFIVSSVLHLRKESKQQYSTTELLTALDYIGFALQKAPTHVKLWKKRENNHYIWHDSDTNYDYGIFQKKNKIWRIVGTYSVFKQAWTKKKKCLLATHIKEFSCMFSEKTVNAQQYIQAVTFLITRDQAPDKVIAVKKIVLLENRVIA